MENGALVGLGGLGGHARMWGGFCSRWGFALLLQGEWQGDHLLGAGCRKRHRGSPPTLSGASSGLPNLDPPSHASDGAVRSTRPSEMAKSEATYRPPKTSSPGPTVSSRLAVAKRQRPFRLQRLRASALGAPWVWLRLGKAPSPATTTS